MGVSFSLKKALQAKPGDYNPFHVELLDETELCHSIIISRQINHNINRATLLNITN